MPYIARNTRRFAVGMELAYAGVVGGLAIGLHTHMLAGRTKILRQPNVIIETDLLIAKEQNTEFKEGALNLRQFQFG